MYMYVNKYSYLSKDRGKGKELPYEVFLNIDKCNQEYKNLFSEYMQMLQFTIIPRFLDKLL